MDEEAFKILNATMCSISVLALSKSFIIKIDATWVGLGVVLILEGRPLSYFSHKLTPHAQSKSVYKWELVAMVFNLFGREFVMHADQKSFLEQWIVEDEFQKWLLKLMSFDFVI